MDIDDVGVIAVLGAGTMGHGIAEVAALAGYDVRLRDVEGKLVRQGYDRIQWSLDKLAGKDRIPDSAADAALERVTPVVDLAEAVGDADVVVEAVPERMDVKEEVYAEIEEHAPERAVFATNTSSLSVTDLSGASDRPGQFCGMHFFNPPVRMQLVEVIAGERTQEATLELIEGLAERMDKTPVRVRKDSPGFVVNRVLTPLMNEAAWTVHGGDATVAEVDSAAKYGLGLPMGCFELADQVGIDVGYRVLEYLHEELGAAYEPCPLLAGKVEAGELGRKSDRGFYDYDDGGADVPTDEVRDDVRRRLLAAMANEAAKLLEADVADVDRAVTLGAGFLDGPAKMADDEGLEPLVETLDDLRTETDAARYAVADLLRERAEAGEGLRAGPVDETATGSFETLRVEREGTVARVVIDRPHRLNTVTRELLDELVAAVETLEAAPDVRALLVVGAGDRAFCAGADIRSMIAGGVDPVSFTELSRAGQRAFGRLEECDTPVVAGIDGYCLGGGMELAMAADLRVASERSELGVTEHSLGIMPGWGGTQRLPRLVGEGRAKEIILTADRYDPEPLADYGFLNEGVETEAFSERALELAATLADGPPVAHRYTKRAMRAGRESVEAGLELESVAFGQLMATDDATEGVSAFVSDREPRFEGK